MSNKIKNMRKTFKDLVERVNSLSHINDVQTYNDLRSFVETHFKSIKFDVCFESTYLEDELRDILYEIARDRPELIFDKKDILPLIELGIQSELISITPEGLIHRGSGNLIRE